MNCAVLIAIFALCLLVGVKGQSDPECEIRGIDCVFVIDTSGSIGSSRFQMIREFTEGLVQLLTIGLQESLTGVILFSTDATLHFNLPTHTDIAALSTAINPDLPYDAGSTNTAAALSLLLSSAQDGTMGLRPGHPAITIVITDGESNVNSAQTIPNAQSVHASNIFQQVYAVGVGNADLTELNAIASDPSLVFNTNSFDSTAIQQLQQALSQRLCDDNENNTMAMGDPHFMVPLVSGDKLCYSIQGYPGLVFNLIYNRNYIINAFFVDSHGDEKDATWIGKLAVIPQNSNKSEAVIFDSVNQEVILVNQGHFTAAAVDTVAFDEMGKMSVKFTRGVAKQTGNPLVHVEYAKPFATFDVSFYGNHLDVDWNMKYDNVPQMHGLIGQFMVKGMSVDPIKKILTYPDSHGPVAVELDNVMTGKTCWKAMNPGHQGEGLIEGSILDYMVSNMLEDDFKFKKF